MISTRTRLPAPRVSSNGHHPVHDVAHAKQRRIRRRVVRAGLLAAAVLIAALYGLPWAYYRLGHIVTHEAVVVGDVTPIGARIDGQIKQLFVEPGGRVYRGDVLAQLEDEAMRARVSEAAANLERAIAEHSAKAMYVDQQRKLLEVQSQRAKADVELAAAKLVQAESEQPRWEKEFERTERLVSSGGASKSYMDEVRAKRDATGASIAAAKAQHRAAELEGVRAQLDQQGIAVDESNLKILASKIQVARCQLATAEADLQATIIRAPNDGWVVQTAVGTGASVKVGQPLLTFWNCDRYLIEAHVNEAALEHIEAGMSADVTLPAYGGEVFVGRVEAVCPISNRMEESTSYEASPLLPNNNQFRVWISLETPGRSLLPGLSAIVGIRW